MWCLSAKPHFQNKELKWHRKQNSIPGSYLYQQCFQKKCFRICIIQACRVDVMWSRLIIKELSLGKKQTDISPAFATVWHHHHNNILREGITPKIKDFLSNISNNYDHNFEFYFCFGQVVAENKHVFFLHFFRLVWTSSLLAMVEFVALS